MVAMTDAASLPYLDLHDPTFSTRGPEVQAARAAHWCARTPFGLAVLRHRQAGQLLRDRRLRQGSHTWPETMGLEGPFADFWQNSLISLEGDAHKRLRALAVPTLSPDFICALEPNFDEIAGDLSARLSRSGRAEFMAAFATPFAGRAICALLAIADADWPEVAADASALGLAMGLNAKDHEPKFNRACARLFGRARDLVRRARADEASGGYVARLVERADRIGGFSDSELENLIVISIFGGVDTTRAQLGFLVALFARHDGEWQKLRHDPSLALSAAEESLRHWPTTTWSTREAIEDFEFDGVQFNCGQIVHIFAYATATDPSVLADGTFNISARRKIHFGFGGGAHACLGQAIARSDIASALRALARHVAHFELDGLAEWLPDSGNTSPARLPIRVRT